MKKRWIIAPLAVAILAIGVLGSGALLAQESDAEGDSTISSLASRVAGILRLNGTDVDDADVQDALNQARREIQDEAIQNKLSAMVDNGVITEEQAGEYLQWAQSRPDGFQGFGSGFGRHGRGFGHGGFGFGMKGMRGFHGSQQAPATDTSGSADTL